MNLLFNPAYIVKPDIGRALLLFKDSLGIKTNDEGFEYFIHPVHAIILNYLNGEGKSIAELASFIGVKESFINDFIDKLVNNAERVCLVYNNIHLFFPKNCIIISNEKRESLDPELFLYDKLDMRMKRHHTPTDVTLMINSICATDCIYCYADRSVKMNCKIPFERIVQLIDEIKSLHGRSFEILGGELFLYPLWKELLIELNKKGFKPYISTKVPLNEKGVKALSAIQRDRIQISLDSMIPKNMCEILKVKNGYVTKIKRFIELLDFYNVKFIIHTIINEKNANIADLDSLYTFLKPFKNLVTWRVDPAEPSLYLNDDFTHYGPNANSFEVLVQYLEQIDDIQINYDSLVNKIITKSQKLTPQAQRKAFNERTVCSANRSQLFILPDGQVTTCEEFYWNPQFIVGNVLKQSLLEVWNSERCRYISFIPQEDIGADSPCSTCDEYYECRDFTQVCFRDIMKKHGKEKWYYPDLKCPKSPALLDLPATV